MKRLLDHLKSATARLLDPESESRIDNAARLIRRELKIHRDRFSLGSVPLPPGTDDNEVRAAAKRVFEGLVQHAWRDDVITPEEKHTLEWAGVALAISPVECSRIRDDAARERFEAAFRAALEDGRVDDTERAVLQRIAASVGMSTSQFVAERFSKESAAMMKSLFAEITRSGGLSPEDWKALETTARRLGIDDESFGRALESQADRLVERMLADAKADGFMSSAEVGAIRWIRRTLRLSPSLQKYLDEQLGFAEFLLDVEEGRLPSVLCRSVELRAGEIAHLESHAFFQRARSRSGRQYLHTTPGILVLTDDRLVFVGASTHQVGLANLLSITATHEGFYLQCAGRAAGHYILPGMAPGVAGALVRSAARRANQTLVQQPTDAPSRHIPRDVRQRVWQRCGGRCVECGATHYLEFDHIIPHARGGSSTDQNVQLLCRGCNSLKSDRI